MEQVCEHKQKLARQIFVVVLVIQKNHITNPMKNFNDLSIKIFADGANIYEMTTLYKNPMIKGFTTNPTLMRKAGVTDYVAFAKAVLKIVPDRPISFEVFSDDFTEMEQQAQQIASWGSHVFV